MSTATKTQKMNSLSAPRCGLLQLMHRIGYGRIEQLPVRNREPVLEPLPRIIREVKLGRPTSDRSFDDLEDFVLKDQELDFLDHLDRLCDGVIEKIEVQAGLPFRIHVPASGD